MKKRIPNSEGEDADRQMAVDLVTGRRRRQQMVKMLVVVVGMELCLMGMVAIQPRKKSTCQFSQNDANQKRWNLVVTQPLVAVRTGTQWPLVRPLLVVQPECVSKPCLAAATMERRPHPLFLRLKEEGEDKQMRSLETVRLKPLVMKLPTTMMGLQEKAKRRVMALEMLQRKKKKERMRLSARRTRSARMGNSVNYMLKF